MHPALLISIVLLAALASALLLSRCFGARNRVCCLMYHRLLPAASYEKLQGTERLFTVPAEEFETQVCELVRQGYRFVTPEQIIDFAEGRETLPDKSVLITFDDGCVSVYELALPILERHGACGTIFMTTDPESAIFAESDSAQRRMTEEEMRDAVSRGLSVGSHSVSHRPLRGLADEEIRHELAESKRVLETITGREVCAFAVPGNWYDARVLRIAREVGYRGLWWSNPGWVRPAGTALGLPRIHIEGHYNLRQFRHALSRIGVFQRALLSWIKWLPGRILGPRFWSPIRRVILSVVPGGYISLGRLTVAGCLLVGLIVFLIILAFARG